MEPTSLLFFLEVGFENGMARSLSSQTALSATIFSCGFPEISCLSPHLLARERECIFAGRSLERLSCPFLDDLSAAAAHSSAIASHQGDPDGRRALWAPSQRTSTATTTRPIRSDPNFKNTRVSGVGTATAARRSMMEKIILTIISDERRMEEKSGEASP